MSPPGSVKVNARTPLDTNDFRQKCFNVDDFQRLARQILPKDLYEYLASGTDDEQTLTMNRSSFQRWCLRPRVLRPVGNISTQVNYVMVVFTYLFFLSSIKSSTTSNIIDYSFRTTR